MLLVVVIECCSALWAYWKNFDTLGGLVIDGSCCRMPLFKEVSSIPSRVDIPEPLRQGETDPCTGSSQGSVSSIAEANLATE